MRHTISRLIGGLVLVAVACGGRSSGDELELAAVPQCIPGQQIACACFDGTSSVQVCDTSGAFAACQCGSLTGSGAVTGTGGTAAGGTSAGGTTAGGTGARGSGGAGGTVSPGQGGTGTFGGGLAGKGAGSGAGGSSTGPAVEATLLQSGDSVLVDVLLSERGIYVATKNEVVLLDRDGTEQIRVTFPRELTAVAVDDSHVAVADQAILTVFDLDLRELGSVTLVESCASMVFVSQDRVVCGPENDWERIFYTYDVESLELLATSESFTYNGIPMQRVPATDDFITVDVELSPSDFHLYSVVASDQVVYVNESPYHGDFGVSDTYAFDGAPPEHLVTPGGVILKIYGDGCDNEQSPFTTTCFTKDGELGTNSADQYFLGMDGDGAGLIYTLATPSTGSFFYDGNCGESDCLAQRIDVGARSILAQQRLKLPDGIGALIAYRYDHVTGRIVLGYRAGDRYYYPSSGDPYPGYRVVGIGLD